MSPAARSHSTPWLAWLGGALLLAALLLVVTHLAEEKALARLLARTRPLWLVSAAALQALTYLCAATVWQRVLLSRGVSGRPWRLVPLGLAKLFTDQALPSAGVSGTLLVVRSLERRGVARSVALSTVLVGLCGFYAAYFVATIAALAILGRRHELGPLTLAPAAVLLLLVAAAPLAALGLRRRGLPRVAHGLERLPGVRSLGETLGGADLRGLFAPRPLLEAAALQLTIFVLDALTLAVTLHAVGARLDLALVFASFVIASVVATLAWIPGGLGSFEGTCVALLHLHGVPIEAALAATLLLRGFTFWLPMLPGFALARRELATPNARADA